MTPALDSLALMGVVLALGFKHGFDADHLAAIDATSRLNRQAGRDRAARWSGAQFSLGHSLVVLLIAQISYRAGGVFLPDWLDAAGAWLSIACLTLVGLLSIRTAGHAAPRAHALPRWLRPLAPLTVSRWGAAVTGALFALSLDTLSMAAWFAGSGARIGGAGIVFLLALAFGAGMLLADGVAGWWVNRLAGAAALQRERGRRYAGWLIGLGALVTAGLGAARQLAAPLDQWADGHALLLGLGLLAATSVLLLAGRRMAPSTPSTRRPE